MSVTGKSEHDYERDSRPMTQADTEPTQDALPRLILPTQHDVILLTDKLPPPLLNFAIVCPTVTLVSPA